MEKGFHPHVTKFKRVSCKEIYELLISERVRAFHLKNGEESLHDAEKISTKTDYEKFLIL